MNLFDGLHFIPRQTNSFIIARIIVPVYICPLLSTTKADCAVIFGYM